MNNDPRVCTRCVMDTSAEDIVFNNEGVCNFCEEFISRSGELLHSRRRSDDSALKPFVSRLREAGKGKKYDCVVGVSGGVDSSWVLVKAVEFGLRPLAVHMDNGWNSELAQNNISNLIKILDVDFVTHVIDWTEYRMLMQAFFDSDVVDVELLYDNAMFAVNYQQARKFGVKTILGGTNQATEGMKMPKDWNHLKLDKRNIKSIAKKYSDVRINSFPAIGVIDFINYEFILRYKWVHFLDMMQFNKEEALAVLTKDFGYKPYPYKHYESVFTRFYQGYLLPKKFNVDKRKAHLSTLIISGQMKRDEALKFLESEPYSSEIELSRDIDYFLKKMNWSKKDLEEYLERPPKLHSEYDSEELLYSKLLSIYRYLETIKKRFVNGEKI